MVFMSWKYSKIRNFANRNKLGLILGLIKGIIISYLFWTKNDYLSQETMKYLTYPLHLIFDCSVPFYGLGILIIICGIIGMCLDALISKWQIKNDRNRGLIILAILVLLIGGIHMYRDNSDDGFCFDVDRDGINDLIDDGDGGTITDCTADSDCSSIEECINNFCVNLENDLGLNINIQLG